MSDPLVEEFLEGLRSGDPKAVDAGDRLLRAMGDVSLTRPLTPREEDVIAHVAAGLNRTQIAETLVLGPETVSTYQQQIRHALGARSMAHAVFLWTNAKWLAELRAILEGGDD